MFYAKNKEFLKLNKYKRSEKNIQFFKNLDNDPRGVWMSEPLLAPTYNQNSVFEIVAPSGKIHLPPEGKCWSYSKEGIEKLNSENRLYFGKNGNRSPRIKKFLSELKDERGITSILAHDDVGGTQSASINLTNLFDNQKIFLFPKPVELIKRLIYFASEDDDIVLDFFAGSATTAQAVMEQNALDSSKRSFIMVQNKEAVKENSKAYKAGYENVFEIAKQRIQKAGQKIKINYPDIDVDFKIYKVE